MDQRLIFAEDRNRLDQSIIFIFLSKTATKDHPMKVLSFFHYDYIHETYRTLYPLKS